MGNNHKSYRAEVVVVVVESWGYNHVHLNQSLPLSSIHIAVWEEPYCGFC